MDKITRYLIRERENGYQQVFPFTTYSLIFNAEKWPKDENAHKLFKFLQRSFLMGFKGLSKSPSSMPELIIDKRKVHQSELCDYAKLSEAAGRGKKQHEIVENYFLENHPDCIGIEVPMNDGEVEGCADILLMQQDPFMIKILDYKPNARNEKKASTQLFYYFKALTMQTGINEQYFELYYFDENDCYQVIKPKNII